MSTQKPPPEKIDNRPLAPGDCITVTIDPLSADRQDDFTKFFQLDSSGDVSMLYIGEIHLAGLTPMQAAQQIHDAYVPKCYLGLNVLLKRCQ